jgi:hypothetical protein
LLISILTLYIFKLIHDERDAGIAGEGIRQREDEAAAGEAHHRDHQSGAAEGTPQQGEELV